MNILIDFKTIAAMVCLVLGAIKGSRKLYYITDWVDEYCDLTLDKFVETLQRQKETFKLKEQIEV